MSDEEVKVKTATELLLEISGKLDLLVKYYKNTDNNTKLILSKINGMAAQTNSSLLNILPTIIPQQNVVASAIKKENLIKAPTFSNNNSEEVIITRQPKQKAEEIKEVPQTQQVAGPKVAVSQLITLDSKEVILAKVKIMDNAGKTIQTTRTQSTGKWMTTLNPGNYIVNVVKASKAEGQKAIDATYNIIVPSTNEKVVELDPLSID